MKKVLIAEDDGALRDMYAAMLRSDYEVFEAKNGTLTLQAVQTRKPDLVLLDIQFPDMSGLDVLTTLKRDGYLDRLKVVVLSNMGSEETMEKALELGASEFIKKESIELEWLRNVCARYLGEDK